jgi:MFS family permease
MHFCKIKIEIFHLKQLSPKGIHMATEVITTNVTRRLDQLHWSRFHTLVTAVLGIGWLLDAFEVNIVGSVLGVIQTIFHLDANQAAWVVSIWLIGIMIGAFVFGYLADHFGRKRLFLITLLMYSVCTVLTALSPTYAFLMLFRFLTAIGVGAEYAAVNSAISEFIPPDNRGKVNGLVMNFWPVGAMLAALVNAFFINLLAVNVGWRVGFAVGAIAAVCVLWMRRALPESPRWLLTKGRRQEAEAVVRSIEEYAGETSDESVPGIEFEEKAAKPFFGQVFELITQYPARVRLSPRSVRGIRLLRDVCILDARRAPSRAYPCYAGSLVLFPGECRSIGRWPHNAGSHRPAGTQNYSYGLLHTGCHYSSTVSARYGHA